MKKSLLPLLLVMAPAAFAQVSPYDGLDINFNQTEPPLYSYCRDVVKIDPTISGDTKVEAMEACALGVDSARRMADRFGGGNGNIQGYFRGYAHGMHEMYEMNENDGVAFKQGEGMVSGMGSFIESGLTEGRNKGTSEGKADGSSEARNRFDKAVRDAVPGTSGLIPSAQVTPPNRVYNPEPNAYGRLVPADKKLFSSLDDILKACRAGQAACNTAEMDQLMLKDFPVYSQYDATEWGDVTRLTWLDLWFDDGRYLFAKALWYDETKAMGVWLDRPAQEKPKYQGLANIVVLNNAGARYDLQAGFRKAFIESYKYYVNYHFAKEFQKGVTMGMLHGKAVGTQIGKRVAMGRGLIAAFNKKFEESARQTYLDSYKGSFMGNFNLTFDDYSKNAKLDIVAFSNGQNLILSGTDDDGIIQPGEAFSLKFKMKNMGGKGTDLKGVLAGDILNQKPVAGAISHLMVKEFDTVEPIAQVDPRLQSGESALVQLTVNGLTTATNIEVQKLVRMTSSPAFETNTLAGAATVTVFAKNVSTIETPAHVSAQVVIDGKLVAEANVGKLGAGQSTKLDLLIKNIDPLDLINSEIPAKVTLLMGGAVLETVNMGIKSKNSNKDLANYLAQLANGKGNVPNDTNMQERLSEVSKLTVNRNRAELAYFKAEKLNAWKVSPDATIPGMIRINKQLGVQSDEALQTYDKLAREMWKDKKVLPAFLFFHAKRNAFKKILKDITLNGKL